MTTTRQGTYGYATSNVLHECGRNSSPSQPENTSSRNRRRSSMEKIIRGRKHFVALQGLLTYQSKPLSSRHVSRDVLSVLHPDVGMDTIGHIDARKSFAAFESSLARSRIVLVLQVFSTKRTRLCRLRDGLITRKRMDTTRMG